MLSKELTQQKRKPGALLQAQWLKTKDNLTDQKANKKSLEAYLCLLNEFLW